jgi:peptidyl-dipeptidase A
MTSENESFIQETVELFKPLQIDYAEAMWEAATTGTKQANRRQKDAQAALMRFWSDPERFAIAKRLHESGPAADPITARQIKHLYLAAAKAQQDEETIERITELEAKLRDLFYNFRAEIGGEKVSDNQLDEVLHKSKDSDEVRRAWWASKEIGVQVASLVRELAAVRNTAAQAQGFRDHFQRMLTLSEINQDDLFRLFENLEQSTRKPFQRLMAEINQALVKRFGTDKPDLMPWHYGDRFFQNGPQIASIDTDVYFADHDPVDLAKVTYDGIGLEVRDILERSDLYPREGKDQHAFCVDIDREGDIRTLNNLQPNQRWNQTLLHELGHAVYDKYIDRELPWLLRTPPHSLSTEGIAMLMGALVQDKRWLTEILRIPTADADRIAEVARLQERSEELVFTRWCLVMTHFERGFYANPEADLDALWWGLVERFQQLKTPPGLQGGEWAAKYHLSLAPVYYHSYEMGYLYSAQVRQRLVDEFGGLVNQPQTGKWLVDNVFSPGCKEDWASHVESSTGEPLNPRYFVEAHG